MNPISLKTIQAIYHLFNDITPNPKQFKAFVYKDNILLLLPYNLHIELYKIHSSNIIWKIELIQDLNSNRFLSYSEFRDILNS